MNGMSTTREQHADRLVNLTFDDLAHKLRLIVKIRVKEKWDLDLTTQLQRHQLDRAVRRLQEAEDFRLERCRVCHGDRYDQIDITNFDDDPENRLTIRGAPCSACAGTGRHR